MRALWLPEVLADAGLPVIVHPGALQRGSETFDPQAVVWHHDASTIGYDPQRYADFLARGRSDLPGPLYNVWIDRTGRCWVIGTGRANHAGSGSWKGISGNSRVIGLCLANNGVGERYPTVQVDAAVSATVAISRHLNIPASLTCGHKEWTPRKPDPAGILMDVIRGQIAGALEESPMNIMGPSTATASQALALPWSTKYYTPEKLAGLITDYEQISRQEGVDFAVAVAQMRLETGNLEYGGDVAAHQFNFAGVGATGGVPGVSWQSATDGVRGHVRRLRMYAAGHEAIYDLAILKRPLPVHIWGKYPTTGTAAKVWAAATHYPESWADRITQLRQVVVVDPPAEWAAESWAKAIAKGLLTSSSVPTDPIDYQRLVTILDRAGVI